MKKMPQSKPYFHGKITRDRAEDLLMSQGAIEGMFLLRESVNGNYVVSICHCNKISHYNIEHQTDGTYQISTGRKFSGPVELVEHHMKHLDGFLTLARIPLERYPSGTSYYILQGVKASFFEELIKKKAIELGLKDANSIEEALNGPMRTHLRRLVLRELHESQHWFHHFIRRTEAEERLHKAGHTEGQYLVRQKRDEYGFVLSVSFQDQPKHYKINCHFEKLNIDGGQYFDSLIEMIDHYHFRQDGLLCKLRFGIECPGFVRSQNDFLYPAGDTHFEGSHSSMCKMVGRPRRNWTEFGGCGVDVIGVPRRQVTSAASEKISPLCARDRDSEWSRDTSADSETRNTQPETENTSLSTADLISFSEWSTNLPRLLTDGSSIISHSLNDLERDPFVTPNATMAATAMNQIQAPPLAPSKPPRKDIPLPIASPVSIFCDSPNLVQGQSVQTVSSGGLNEPQIIDHEWQEPDMAFSPIGGNANFNAHKTKASSMPNKLLPSDLNLLDPLFAIETQKVYDALPENDVALNISRESLEIRQKLGGGNFGCVFGGYYTTATVTNTTTTTTCANAIIPVAIKMLKDEVHSQLASNEILLEAKTMSQLKHQNIVRLIGVCKTDQLWLVLELAPLGPINKYLRRHQNIPVCQLLDLSCQIARGMAYLEASKFVHRDLAARNVLLVNETYAKISDFGMSKALNVGHEYYRATSAGRWPLKWYAPECIYYFRFNSKSDVWSYGVTLWEMFSYGDRPYKGMKGTDILAMLDRGQRMRRPVSCPDNIYEIMVQCWSIDEVRRPTFAELVLIMSRLTKQAAAVAAVISSPLTAISVVTTASNSSGCGDSIGCIVSSTGAGAILPQAEPTNSLYQANSSGSSVARTCYESGESSQLSSPPISSKPTSYSGDRWSRNFLKLSSKVVESVNSQW